MDSFLLAEAGDVEVVVVEVVDAGAGDKGLLSLRYRRSSEQRLLEVGQEVRRLRLDRRLYRPHCNQDGLLSPAN